MDNSDLLRYKGLFLSKREELSTGKGLADSISAAGGLRGDTADICGECGEPISKRRLEAVPWTRHCKECKERKSPRN
jgi:RNA polymerase-binding transcription factor DksA